MNGRTTRYGREQRPGVKLSMKTAQTALVALAIVGATAAASAQEQKPSVPSVVTQGEAVLRRAPDQAFVDLAVETRARLPKEASAANAQAMSAVQQKLRSLGLAADALRTQGYQLNPEFDYVSGRQVLRGYMARNSIEVRVDRLEQLPDVIDSGIAAGATSAGAIRFDLRDRTAVEREALKAAVADARARADAAAAGAGMTVARVLMIQEGGRSPVPPPMPMAMRASMDMKAEAPTPISAGEIEIRASVTLTAEIKQ
jgi:uncharacterized protein YggE